MRKNIQCLFFALIFISGAYAQKITISGYVLNSITNEVVIGANIYNPTTKQGTTTNKFGFYAFQVPQGAANINVTCVGFSPLQISSNFLNDTLVTFKLIEGFELGEVAVTANRTRSNDATRAVSIPTSQIRLLPTFTGEKDLLKAFQYIPGIAQGAEGNNNLYVRGGSPDQNMILLDDVPLYYVNHISGLVSIFDENSVSDVSIYKSGFPARYGGRLSSVVDIRMKNGKMDKLGGNISVGLLSSKLSLEGPIIKDKMSFMISARKSMTDLYLRPLTYYMALSKTGYMQYAFYDLNGKLNYKLSNKDRLYLSFYNGVDNVKMNVGFDTATDDVEYGVSKKYDDFKFSNEAITGWGNTMGCARWNHVYSSKLFSNLTLAASNYYYRSRSNSEIVIKKTGLASESFLYDFKSGVFDRLAKLDFDYYPTNNHHIRFGGSATMHRFTTGSLHQKYHVNMDALVDTTFIRSYYRSEMDTTYGSEPMNAIETSGYVEDEMKLFQFIALNAGAHFASYHYGSNNFYSLQPRLSIRFLLNNGLSINTSFVQMTQFIHLLTGSDTSTPTDIWVPATTNAKPEKSNQFSIGFEKNFDKRGLKLTVEGFYKTLDELIDYKLGATLVSGNQQWYDKIETDGTGKVYGTEFLIEKTSGKLTGWLGYTLSKNMRKFEDINSGTPFPYVYDRPHDLSLVVNYKLNKKITISGTWEYRSGRRMTLGAAGYDANVLLNSSNIRVNQGPCLTRSSSTRHSIVDWGYETATIFGTKNNYKLEDYHKLCINTNFTKQKKRGVRTITLGVNNVYNRKNPYNIYYVTNEDKSLSMKKITLFPIMPSFSYSFDF